MAVMAVAAAEYHQALAQLAALSTAAAVAVTARWMGRPGPRAAD
jgi:hypothetical protein